MTVIRRSPASRPLSMPAVGGARHEFVCRECGYGVFVSTLPMHCPMCHHFAWRPAGARRGATAMPT